MELKTFEVSGKKEGTDEAVKASIEIEQFSNTTEAVAFFDAQLTDEDRAAGETGESVVCDLINSQYKTNRMNAKRIELTKGVNPFKLLREKVKASPEAKAKLNSFLAELGITEEMLAG